MRYAHLTTPTDEYFAIARYLPDNYRILWDGVAIDGRHDYVIGGDDVAGWTLDGYVIPRLASGLRFAREVDRRTLDIDYGLPVDEFLPAGSDFPDDTIDWLDR